MNVQLGYFTIREYQTSCHKAPPLFLHWYRRGKIFITKAHERAGAGWQCKIDKWWMRKNPEIYKNKSLHLETWLPQFSSCGTKILLKAKTQKVHMKRSSRETSGRGSLFGLNGWGLGFKVYSVQTNVCLWRPSCWKGKSSRNALSLDGIPASQQLKWNITCNLLNLRLSLQIVSQQTPDTNLKKLYIKLLNYKYCRICNC